MSGTDQGAEDRAFLGPQGHPLIASWYRAMLVGPLGQPQSLLWWNPQCLPLTRMFTAWMVPWVADLGPRGKNQVILKWGSSRPSGDSSSSGVGR